MKKCERRFYPLTTAQRGLYFSHKITPSGNMNIAEAVEICGQIDPEIFHVALRQLVVEAEELRVRITEQDGKPMQDVLSVYEGEFPYIDMSHAADPRAAIEAWMKDELARPIDLAYDPLWVSALLKAADDRYFWYHRANHIGVDGYGGGLIARRLAELYTAFAESREPMANSFCTVEASIAAEASYRDSGRFQRDREYWHQQLVQLPEALTLSRSHRRHGLSSDLRRSTGYLPAETARRLAELGKAAAASLPQVLIGLVATYYQRVTRVSDLVFLMPVSGRINAVLRRSLAPSVNAVPIRLSFTPAMTASELFAQVSRTVRQALRHQQYRYEDLRRDLGRIGQEQNIAWLGVNIEPFDYHLNFNGATTISYNLSNSSAEDLMVFVYDRGTDTGLRFDLDANPALYELDELDEHRRRLTLLIEQVLANPDMPLKQLDILGDEERRRLLFDWNDTTSELQDTRLPELVAKWATATPDAPAVVFENTVVSYRQLHNRSIRQARQLIANGVEPGDIIAVALPRSEQLLIVLLAIMRTGAAYLPIDLDSPPERTTLVLDDASPIVLITQPQMHGRFVRNNLTLLRPEHIDSALNANNEQEPDRSTADSTAYVLYTSGSTGRPKGVEVTHRNLTNFLEGMQHELALTASDRFVAVTTVIFDIAGLELYLPLTVGARVVMASSEAVHDPISLARLIRRSGTTHMQATPSLWRILLASSQTKLDDVHVLVGGEALSTDLATRLKGAAARVTQFYGPTETTVWSTAFELGDIGTVPPPIGRPIINTQLYVLDEYLQPVVTGAIGELYIGGEGVAKGYLHRPKLNEERFLGNPFSVAGGRMYRTGDLVRWIDDGLLEFMGRSDAQVKVNGHRVELGEIENILLQHEMISEAVVTAHHDGGTVSLASYLVAYSNSLIDVDSIRVFLAGHLPSYMMPDSFIVLDALPLTPNGKLDRKMLPLPEWANRNAYVEPVTPIEKKLAELWQRILKVERVGLHDNFFELGGDSLNAAEMTAFFPALFEMELALGSLFEAPTVGALAALIERLSSSEYIEPLSVMLPLRRVAHQPLFCIHPMIGVSMGFSALLQHIDPMIPVYGLQSRGLRGGVDLPDSIEEIAADYLAQIRLIQPEGPYRLIGRSLGGLLGHSIAELMQAQGFEVELLAMIDSYLFMSGERVRQPAGIDEVRMALGFLGIDLVHENMPTTLEALGEFLLHPDNARSIPQVQGVMKLSKEISKGHPEFIKHLAAVMFNNLKLARHYVPRKVNVDLLYFQAMEVTGDLDGILNRDPTAWRPFVGSGFQVHELACHHENVLDPAPAAQIGNILQQRLSTLKRQQFRRPSALQQEKEAITPVYA